MGRPVMNLGGFIADETEATFVKKVSMSNLASGMYHLVLSDERKKYVKQIIKG
jgi:hypothetical protein